MGRQIAHPAIYAPDLYDKQEILCLHKVACKKDKGVTNHKNKSEPLGQIAIQKMSTNLLVRAIVVFCVLMLDQNQNQISCYPLIFLEKLICQIRSVIIVIEDIFKLFLHVSKSQ